MRKCELGVEPSGSVSTVEVGLRGQGSPVARQKRGLKPPQKVMRLGAGVGRRRLITISTRLA